jgi:tetratricopeptide (TPR) repeat protein
MAKFWVALLYVANMANAQSAIEGYIKEGGKPVANALIAIQRQDVARSYQAKTDKRGSYFQQGLPVGFYAVKVVVDGQERAGVSGIRTQPGGSLEVSFDLDATPQAQESRIRSELKKAGAEWSLVKIMAVERQAGTTTASNQAPSIQAAAQPAPSSASASQPKSDSAGVHYRNAMDLGKAGKWEEMRGEMKKAAELDPATAYITYYNAGVFLSNAGQAEAGIEAYRLAIAAAPNEPKNAESYYQYGLALMAQAKVSGDGKLMTAPGTAETFEKYLKFAPNGPNAQSARELLKSIQ